MRTTYRARGRAQTAVRPLLAKVFVIIPLGILAVIVFGIGIYNTLCKNANIQIGC